MLQKRQCIVRNWTLLDWDLEGGVFGGVDGVEELFGGVEEDLGGKR